MAGGRKRCHVGTDLGQDHFRCHAAHARDRDQTCDGVTKGHQHLSDSDIESGDPPFQLLDQAEVMVDQKAMMRSHATV